MMISLGRKTCPDCGEYWEECKCEEESLIDELNDLADLANKGANAINKWKKILNPPTAQYDDPRMRENMIRQQEREEQRAREAIIRQQPEEEQKEKEGRSRKRHKQAVIIGLSSVAIGIIGIIIAFVI